MSIPINLPTNSTMINELCTLQSRTINIKGEVLITEIYDDYFFKNDEWHITAFNKFKQFQDSIKNFRDKRKNVFFRIKSKNLNLEFKYLFLKLIVKEDWSLSNLFNTGAVKLNKIAKFFNEVYPNLNSLLDCDINTLEKHWFNWLTENNIPIKRRSSTIVFGDYEYKSGLASFLKNMYINLIKFIDKREEWEKDKWDIRNLEKYGLSYNKTLTGNYLNFEKIESIKMRELAKKYLKNRLITGDIAFATARFYIRVLTRFFQNISKNKETRNSLNELDRCHIEAYIEFLFEYAANKNLQSTKNFVREELKTIRRFLNDIITQNYAIAPYQDIRFLIYPQDLPKHEKKNSSQIDYIPDFVLEQLFEHINDLHKDLIPVVWIAFKTGLRISDVLTLQNNCLAKVNGKYSIITDIAKTFVKGHRIPIDNKLADIIAVLIADSKSKSTKDNNPNNYIFAIYKGKRKGMPFTQHMVRAHLNHLSKTKNIIDEQGEIFHFKTHQFRHTYAVKLLNGGADILTIQELLAHSSPEMTLRYAKLLDDTKRKAFESVIDQGAFSFDVDGKIKNIQHSSELSEKALNSLWQEHKLNAMDNPYGTCHARLSGDCPYMEAPPCLTCNSGKPCKDLAIGFSDLDVEKYELHIKSTVKSIELAKNNNRQDMVEKHINILNKYEEILGNIKDGNIIFGRSNRIKV
ncbi:TPA: tyrosine-type recombinase/integrase [Staphylococcus aureus]